MKTDKLAKDLQEDKEYLKHCLERQNSTIGIFREEFLRRSSREQTTGVWWEIEDVVQIVAHILDRYGQFKDISEVIDFFEKPYNFEDKMRFIVEEI
jgi:hypothetical protein